MMEVTEGMLSSQCATVQIQQASRGEQLARLFAFLPISQGDLTETQIEHLRKVIAKSVDVFAVDDTELVYTDLVQHQMDRGYSPPVKQAARRVPFIHWEKTSESSDPPPVH